MGHTRRVVDGDSTASARRLRSAAPPPDGPLAGSGAAPDSEPEQPPGRATQAESTIQPEPTTQATATTDQRPADRPDSAPAGHSSPRPARGAAAAVRAVGAWARRPTGRLALPALLLLVLVAATGAAGALLVPATAHTERLAAAGTGGDPDVADPTPAGPDPTLAPTTPPIGVPTGIPTTAPPGTGGRPADVLAGWAQQTGDRVGIPAVAMQAYGYTELVLAQTTPTCQLTWTTLAAIGLVESNHGRANGASLAPDGQAVPQIIGLPLDGKGGRQLIADTDAGQLDGDHSVDRAVGPMQFIPSTWRQSGVDADNDGVKNPHDIDDAALAAGNYLCSGGRDLSTAADWWNGILSYNDVRPYAQAVFDAANRYGTASRT
jgi:membrane-bound lytic murein transglycosylase B